MKNMIKSIGITIIATFTSSLLLIVIILFSKLLFQYTIPDFILGVIWGSYCVGIHTDLTFRWK